MPLNISKSKPKPTDKISKLIDLFSFLSESKPNDAEVAVYRGHMEFVDNLKPSIFRKKGYIEKTKELYFESS